MTAPNKERHQSIMAVHQTTYGGTFVAMTRQEMYAITQCAAKLAHIEGMTGTAERLEYDAAFWLSLEGDAVVRVVNS